MALNRLSANDIFGAFETSKPPSSVTFPLDRKQVMTEFVAEKGICVLQLMADLGVERVWERKGTKSKDQHSCLFPPPSSTAGKVASFFKFPTGKLGGAPGFSSRGGRESNFSFSLSVSLSHYVVFVSPSLFVFSAPLPDYICHPNFELYSVSILALWNLIVDEINLRFIYVLLPKRYKIDNFPILIGSKREVIFCANFGVLYFLCKEQLGCVFLELLSI